MIQKTFFILAALYFSTPLFAKEKITAKQWDDLTYEQVMTSKIAAPDKADKKSRAVSSIDISPDYKASEPFLMIRDPEVLQILEQKGFSFYSHFNTKADFANLALFYPASENYRLLADTVKNDLVEMTTTENANPKLAPAGVGMKYSRRVFDARWFMSPYAKFELIGVINRLDRVSFDSGTCGETRFIYRLSYYSKSKNYSRLPLTVMVKYRNSGEAKTNWQACKDYEKAWVYPTGFNSNDQLVAWMIGNGPLKSDLRVSTPQSIEINLQAMRIPSKARPDLAGHGTYLLRSFSLNAEGKLKPGVLENTPDVKKINSTPVLKAEFINQFKDRHFVNRLSEGILKLDDKYLAKRAWSYSPYGIARKENRLFDQIITEADLKAINFDQSSYVRSPAAAIMRLNDFSCVGCHQARAHAGFHFLGIDKKSTHPLNAIFFEGSGHFEIELKRRSEYMKQVLNNLVPDPRRDFSISPGEIYNDSKTKEFKKSGYGHFCGLGQGPFSHWQCEAGLSCQSLDEAEKQTLLGKCFPDKAMAGDPILVGTLTQSASQTDKLVVTKQKECGTLDPKYSFGTFDKSGGFPSGICYRKNCKGIKEGGREVCADSAGNGFNACVASTASGQVTFSQCLERSLVNYGFSGCSETQACRNDFVCARSKKNEGYCTPSYFLFQIRVDGHADPIKGL